ncbi:hypothetical protein [Limnofasciculus baicalensis]|uniref:PIN domain-containing protein n=1 Tax=Limnofasciculus baicalensis BBK-W-15 TaxID=2699891 RepID=A0AAE3GW72_9CYAN|nr:hypothetical protein [Limnofasciculus baicalensis]MCP2729697.1 hypothetical protein [Limnofasciculus baicalensis BBK-W-15]
MNQSLLIDNDALLKLARYGLLDQALALFKCTPTDVSVLPAAKYRLLPAKNRLRFCKDEESAARLEAFFKTSNRLDAGLADPDLLDILNAVPNIDAGEALLFAVAANNRNTLVITGDKRSLEALCSYDSVAHVSKALAGRVVSVEVLFSMLAEYRFTLIQELVRAKPDVDKTLNNVFGVTVPADFESVKEGFASYISDLRRKTGTLLYVPSD